MVKRMWKTLFWTCGIVLIIAISLYLALGAADEDSMLEKEVSSGVSKTEEISLNDNLVCIDDSETKLKFLEKNYNRNKLNVPSDAVPLGVVNDDLIYYRIKDTQNEQIVFQFFLQNMNTDACELLFETNQCFTILGTSLMGENIIFAELKGENDFTIELNVISLNGKKRSSFEFTTTSLPEIDVLDNNVILSYDCLVDEKIFQKIVAINVLEQEEIVIKEAEYSMNETMCSGVLLDGVKATEKGVLFQEICFENEEMFRDESGVTKIAFYDYETEMSEVLFELPYKLSYIGGSAEYVVTNQYSYEEPKENTGKVLKRTDDAYVAYSIDQIGTINDIKNTWIFKDIVIIQCIYNTYVLDKCSMEYSIINDSQYVCVWDESSIIVKCSDGTYWLDLLNDT